MTNKSKNSHKKYQMWKCYPITINTTMCASDKMI